MIREAIAALIRGEGLSVEESAAVMEEIMTGRTADSQIGAYLVALSIKGPTAEEIAGAARAMREKALRIEVDRRPLLDTCGTGGDGRGTFNISTAAAFVAAGAGAAVAKHGNRAASSKCGSADVLVALGVDVTVPPEAVAACIEEIGIGFLFAPLLHRAMKHAAGPRRELGIKTIFNVLGPLTNPAGADRQLLGVYDRGLIVLLAQVLGRLGSERALVVHGSDGLDEATLTGTTYVAELSGGEVREWTIDPEALGLSLCTQEDLKGGDADENAQILAEILGGRKGPQRDMVLLNAAAALLAAGLAADLAEGLVKAAESIDSGAAGEKLARLVEQCKV